MGTEVHHTSYLPGFCTMRDLNEDADGCWSQYYEDKMSGQNIYNCYQLRPSNGYSEYDKEMLKRTMLEHEAVFRKQVYELHRIYRIQKDMMDELKRGASVHLQSDTSQSNSFSSQIPSEGTNKMFQMAHLPGATTCNNSVPPTVTEDNAAILNFLNESNMQSGPVSIGKEVAPKVGDMFDSNKKGLAKRTFDLQLPAEVYIDCEDEISEKEIVAESSFVTTVALDRIQCSDPEDNVKLNLAMAKGHSYREDSWRSDIHTRGGSTTGSLADLNEPAREICFGKASGSVSTKFLGLQTSLAENQGRWLPTRSNTNFAGLPIAYLKGRHCNEGTSSNHLRVDDDETSRGWPFFNNETGQRTSNMESFCPRTSKGKFPIPSQQKQLNQKQILSVDHNKREAWFKPQHEISRRSPPDGRATLPFPNSFPDTFLDYTDAASPLRSSWNKPANGYSHAPLAVPSLQYLNGTTTENHSNPYDKWQYSGDLRSHLSGVGPSSYQNGFNNGAKVGCSSASQLHNPPFTFGKPNLGGRSEGNLEGCGPGKSQKDVHFNHTLPNGFQNGFSTPKINEPEGKCEYISGTLSWLRGKPTSKPPSLMELDLSQGYPQLKCAGTVMNHRNERSQETGKHCNLFTLQGLLSSSQFKETTARNITPDGQSSKKIFGFSIPERTHESAALAHPREQSQAAVTESNEKVTPKLPILGTRTPHCDLAGKSGCIASGNHINLNFDLNSSDLSAEGEMLEAPSQVPAPTDARQIHLEAPIILEEEKLDEVVAKEAADSILLMSSEKQCSLYNIPCHPPASASFSSLHWFAGVVSSNPEIVKETSDDSLDSFELLTLELEETKPEEFWCRSWEGHDQNNEEDRKSSIASLLFTKPRRGQARKRRQKRDFQRDILPGIASLSRHEVTQDLQTIGTLMKASGQSWQAGGTMRRNAGRNGTASRGRVGRRPRSLAVTVEEIQVSPPHPSPPPQPPAAHPGNVTTEIEVDGRSMIGWGRTTRRCRRQRLPPVTNVAAPLT